ncbi:MAG: hypothetical protein ACOYMA_02580 [Bacteroidia bacterium]
MNSKLTRIEIHASSDSAMICLENDSCIRTPICLEVPRSYNDFGFVVKNDTIKKTIRIKSKVAPEFKWGNLIFFYYCPIGYIIDASSRQKIYNYDNSILIDFSKKKVDYKKWSTSKKGQYYLRGSIPWFDFIEFDNGRGFKNYKSYFGLIIGGDYYHSKKSYLTLSVGATGVSDIGTPVMDRELKDTNQFVNSFSAKLTNNHDIKIFSSDYISFTFGYGLSFTHFRYKQNFEDSINNKTIELFKSNKSAIGLVFDANIILFKYGFIGLSVLPSYYTLNNSKWEYSYLSYIDFGLRLPLGDYNKNKMKVIKYKPKLLE